MNDIPTFTGDPECTRLLRGEVCRQSDEMELIASENYVSANVLHAMGTVFTNKYSEGYPGRRYYAGQEYTDQVEDLARERAKKLFNAKYANVQPLSGAPANFAVYLALLNPGDTIMGMDLAHGGHLTHGAKPSATSKLWKSVQYGVHPDTGRIDYDQVREIALRERPHILVAGFSAYPRTVDWKSMKQIADEVGAKTMADVAHIAGFIAAGQMENPLDVGFDVMTTTTHKTLRGPRGGVILTNNPDLAKKIDSAVFPGLQGGPHMHSILAKALAFGEAAQPAFAEYMSQVGSNAQALAAALQDRGVELITGGTENHIVLMNVASTFQTGGKAAQNILEKAGMSTNRNTIPRETRTPFDPSGIRLGTPAMTTRGFRHAEFEQTAEWIVEVLRSVQQDETALHVRDGVRTLCLSHPLPS